MNDQELRQIGNKLREALPQKLDTELNRDLWPAFLQKMQEPRFRVPWFDWALAALAAAVLIFFPGVIPALLYLL